MPNQGASVGAAIFGGLTFCILVCIFTIGFPALIAGVILLARFNMMPSMVTTGVVLVVVSSLMVTAGIVFAVLTVVCANKASQPTGPARVGVAPNRTIVVAPGPLPAYTGPPGYDVQSVTTNSAPSAARETQLHIVVAPGPLPAYTGPPGYDVQSVTTNSAPSAARETQLHIVVAPGPLPAYTGPPGYDVQSVTTNSAPSAARETQLHVGLYLNPPPYSSQTSEPPPPPYTLRIQ